MNKTIIVKSILLVSLYIVGIGSASILINKYYPDSQGFNRTIIFPRNEENPYYIIDDEIFTAKQERSNLYFHGLGTRTISDQSVSWQLGDVVVNITIVSPSVLIIPVDSYVYQSESLSRNRYGVQIQPLEVGTTRIISILSSYNSSLHSNNPLKYEEVSLIVDPQGNTKAWKINDLDYFVYPLRGTSISVSRGSNQKVPINIDTIECFDISTNSHRLFFRLNDSLIPTEIYSYGTLLSYNNSIQGSGHNLESLIYDHNNNSQIFTSDDDLSISIKHETVGTPPPDLTGLSHPYLYFRESQRFEIESRINGTIPGPWQSWFTGIGSWSSLVDKAFKAYMEEDIDKINELIPQVLDIASLEPFRQNLERGTGVVSFILAYDLLYNYMTPEQRDFFESEAYRITYPSADSIINNVCPNNNHRLVTLCSYGLLGLVLKNQGMIQLMQNQIDKYLTTHIIRGGACFEGPSYADYTFGYTNLFMYALKQLGGYNYFLDPNYIEFLNHTIQTRSPDGTAALFEDAHDYANLNRVWLYSVNQIQTEFPDLASNIFWDLEQKGLLNIWAGPSYNNIMLFNATGSGSKPETPLNGSYVYFDSGLAGLGSGQGTNDTILMISNKQYYQSHAHYDENSFEFWAFGKKIISNAGYPNYGSAGHSYSLSTSANNAIEVAGDGQYLIESDGFDSFLQSSNIQLIESPTFLPYEHALSFSHFVWGQIFIAIGVLIGFLVFIMVYPEIKRSSIDQYRVNGLLVRAISKNRILQNISDKVYVRSLNIIQFTGFMMIFYLSTPYLLKGIEHMETWPNTKALLTNLLWIVLLGLGLIAFFIIAMRNKYRINLERENISIINLNDENNNEVMETRENILHLSNIFFYIVWFILMTTFMFGSFNLLQVNLFTEGSTVQNFMTNFKTSVVDFWYGWLLIVVCRYLINLLTIYTSMSLKSKIIHDVIRFSVFALIFGVGVFMLQQIGIELINDLGIS
jgi:hypothetical protein